MKENDNLISVNILDRSYKVKCPPEQAQELQVSAAYVNEHMQRLQNNTHLKSSENLAIVTALNIGNELMELKKQHNQEIDAINNRIRSLQKRIEEFLANKDKIAV